ncbi:hypothetical protein ADICYQ_1292 [Cyclobacterium qasimii M12-11B]|uniref:Uncharacterized protein n=1 Tax=Cyclobacterium qasimii M12-11B TaxID=641524 RepID=S7VJ15_9BACT|nr:hypothetical protein ADICYQ_1292 [Cyclobacterium qasimii M12-11B]
MVNVSFCEEQEGSRFKAIAKKKNKMFLCNVFMFEFLSKLVLLE